MSNRNYGNRSAIVLFYSALTITLSMLFAGIIVVYTNIIKYLVLLYG